jgi:hypothetical protein
MMNLCDVQFYLTALYLSHPLRGGAVENSRQIFTLITSNNF